MEQHKTLKFTSNPETLSSSDVLVVIGRKAQLEEATTSNLLPVAHETWLAMLESASPGDWGCTETTWVGSQKIVAGVLPENCSRHNSPSRAWAIPKLAKPANAESETAILLVLEKSEHAFAAALACARSLPLYDARSKEKKSSSVTLCLVGPDGIVEDNRIEPAMEGVRLAARLFDTPTSEMHCDILVEECEAIAQRVGASITVKRGQDLIDGGFGGLWSVGKAAEHGPALAVLEHNPEGATKTVVWVGKGIVYDTGGLSIKTKGGMPGMKGDMGGSAAVLGAFQAAVQSGFPQRLVAIACIAENAVGPGATRPDDVITMWSKKTVEVNNTDAEGRLVLADGVAWAAHHYQPDLLVDAATLTGAALVASGKLHAAVYSNSEDIERLAVESGRRAGEPCHPLVFVPELLRKEFESPVADMKNSVKSRSNAQSACAAQFIANHLPDPAPNWLHIDLAGPAWNPEERGTGYGVGLLMELSQGI